MDFDYFRTTMKKTFQKEINPDDVSYESFDFQHEELDELLIPAKHLNKLPDPLLFETLSYVDDKGYEWIAGFVRGQESGRKLYEVWIKNGKQLAYEIYVD